MFTNLIHPFEKSGLGTAPFKCYGVRENVFVDAFGNAKAGGCCHYCFTGIRYEYVIKGSAADDKSFVVGCECVKKTGSVENFRETRLQFARERRQASLQQKRAARQAAWAAERAERDAARAEVAAKWVADNQAFVDQLVAYSGQNSFLVAMKEQLSFWGKLTDNQMAVTVRLFKSLDEMEKAKTTSEFFGEVGVRSVNVKVRVLRSIRMEDSYYGYQTQQRWLVSMVTESGSQLVWWTSSCVEPTGEDEYDFVSFSVKSHAVYKEVKQTTITRVKFLA